MRRILLFWAIVLLMGTGTGAQSWKGKITYTYSGSQMKEYDPASKTDKVLFSDAAQGFLTPGGEIYYIDQVFRKRNQLIRRSNPTFTQFRDILDLSSENPQYTKQLQEYSVIRKTGNSGVLSSLYHPKLSPNGKLLSLTIYGYGDQIYNKNCVAVFELATGKEVARFDEKYYGSWTPDNRLVLSGADKTTSVDGGLTKATTPGIFITDAALSTVKRIDPDLDDPSPYHAAVSPDGRQVAFILNDHVWAMNLDGSNLRALTAVDNDNIETFPAWSPDGKQVACWSYKTFERSYFTAIAIVPATASKPAVLSNTAPVWPRDARNYRLSGGGMQLNWKGSGSAPAQPAAEATAPAPGPKKGKAPAPPAPAPPSGPAVGTQVRIVAEDGKTYGGTIQEIKDGKYRVKYQGFTFEAWLLREQFEIKE